MNEKERDELLIRVDERTESLENEMKRRLDGVEKDIGETQGKIKSIDDRVQSNEDDLSKAKAAIGGFLALFSGALAKLFKVI